MHSALELELGKDDLLPEPRYRPSNGRLNSVNIGDDYWAASIEQIEAHLPYRSSLESIVADLHKDAESGRGAIFWGNQGAGKTACACICLMEAMARGASAYFADTFELRRAFERPSKEFTPNGQPVLRIAKGRHFLAIDDLGAESLKVEFGQPPDTRFLEEVVRARNSRRLVTYITTNLSPTDLLSRFASFGTILADKSRFRLVEVSGKFWR